MFSTLKDEQFVALLLATWSPHQSSRLSFTKLRVFKGNISFGKGQRMVATDLFTVYLLEFIQNNTVGAEAETVASMLPCTWRSWRQQQTSSGNLEAKTSQTSRILLSFLWGNSSVVWCGQMLILSCFHVQNIELELQVYSPLLEVSGVTPAVWRGHMHEVQSTTGVKIVSG